MRERTARKMKSKLKGVVAGLTLLASSPAVADTIYLFDYPQIAPQVEAANELLIETGYYGNVPGCDPFYCNPMMPYHPNIWSMAFADAISAYDLTFGIPAPGTTFIFGSAGVPEPATWAMMLLGFAGLSRDVPMWVAVWVDSVAGVTYGSILSKKDF
jgi:hypothetical protein